MSKQKSRGYIFKRRLLKLASFLEALPRKRFDFNSWVGDTWKGKSNLSCGTTACAFGWATTMAIFRKLGLRMSRDRNGFPTIHLVGQDVNDRWTNTADIAANVIFGLDDQEFEYLFLPTYDYDPITGLEKNFGRKPGSNATPKQVAKHIRRYAEYKYGKGDK
jgi:hypothetical protein